MVNQLYICHGIVKVHCRDGLRTLTNS